jgi:TIR domain
MRQKIRFFCSYAEKDSQLVSAFLDALFPHFKASRAYEYAIWDFHRLLAGEPWHDRIQAEIAACDFGLLFLSPAFLASDYIAKEEIPPLMNREGIVPIGLKPVDFHLHDGQSLDDYQVFRFRTPRRGLCWFSELRGADREAFVFELFRQIEARLAARSLSVR